LRKVYLKIGILTFKYKVKEKTTTRHSQMYYFILMHVYISRVHTAQHIYDQSLEVHANYVYVQLLHVITKYEWVRTQ